MNISGKVYRAVGLAIAIGGIAHAGHNPCFVEIQTVSVGKDDHPGYFFVTDNANWWRLGQITDPVAQQRYATALAAYTSGQRIEISYTTGSYCLPSQYAYSDNLIGFVRIIPD